jgi:hypothetical protein
MDNSVKNWSCFRAHSASNSTTPGGSKQICIPMSREQYDQIWADSQQVRQFLETLLRECPELFPPSMLNGYRLTGSLPESKKLPGIQLRQVRTAEGVYSLRPSFVFSYMSGTVEAPLAPVAFALFRGTLLGGDADIWS